MNTATGAQQSATDWVRQALLSGAVASAHMKALAERAGMPAIRTGDDNEADAPALVAWAMALEAPWFPSLVFTLIGV